MVTNFSNIVIFFLINNNFSIFFLIIVLSINHIQWYFDQGYTKVDKVIPQSYITSALRVVNFWLGQNPIPKVNLLGNVDLTGGNLFKYLFIIYLLVINRVIYVF